MWTYPYYGWEGWNYKEKTESVMGFGAGAGIEYDWRALSPNLPPIRWNAEIGLGRVGLEYYNFSTLMFGVGGHYRF